MVAEEIKNQQQELTLDVEGGDTFGQPIRSFQERTLMLSMLQAYLHGLVAAGLQETRVSGTRTSSPSRH
jgi:hypothetical protein